MVRHVLWQPGHAGQRVQHRPVDAGWKKGHLHPRGTRFTYGLAVPGATAGHRSFQPGLLSGRRPRRYCHLPARPFHGEETEFIPYETRVWNFRSAWSRDGSQFAFCRAEVGSPSAIWLVDADGAMRGC